MQGLSIKPLQPQVPFRFARSKVVHLSHIEPMILVSYLFRSLGAVVGLSVASTILQGSLRHTLKQKLEGTDIDDVR